MVRNFPRTTRSRALAALAAGAIMLFMWVVIYQTLRPTSNIVAWIDWGDSIRAVGLIALIGLGLTLIPTLVMTRKYLKV